MFTSIKYIKSGRSVTDLSDFMMHLLTQLEGLKMTV